MTHGRAELGMPPEDYSPQLRSASAKHTIRSGLLECAWAPIRSTGACVLPAAMRMAVPSRQALAVLAMLDIRSLWNMFRSEI